MNNLIEIKNINSLIQNIVSNFDLNDFIPSEIDENKICGKFNSLLSEKQIFWTTHPKKQDFRENWCLINIKSSFPNYEVISVCFIFEKNKIKNCVCDDVSVLRYVGLPCDPIEHIFESGIIYYKDIMLDHQILVDHLCDILKRAIQFAHREKIGERYPNK